MEKMKDFEYVKTIADFSVPRVQEFSRMIHIIAKSPDIIRIPSESIVENKEIEKSTVISVFTIDADPIVKVVYVPTVDALSLLKKTAKDITFYTIPKLQTHTP